MSSHQLDEERIFHTARLLPSSDAIAEYLDQVCAGDQALRERVEQLLRVHEQEQSFLKSNYGPLPTKAMVTLSIAPGQQIGRYKLLQKIGEGGFGVVFMAEQSRPVRRKVALKVIKPGMDTEAVVARFEAERQALAMMDHPNIARVFDGGATEGGRPYFVMELVKGVPITEYCDKNELSTEQRLRLFTTVCQAVQHAHQKGVIHRDLKPSNVLVTLADGEPVVKVIDFGVAKATNQQLTEKTLFTAFGQMVGTPQYMSPEQAEMSCLDVDTRSDVYSLGVLLYELLTGTTPLETERLRTAGYAEMQRLIREEEPPKPSTRLSTSGAKLTILAKHRKVTPEKLKSQVKGDLDWIVMKALEKDRNRRYESASAIAGDIERFVNNEPVQACSPSSVYRFRKFVARNKSWLAVAGTISLILVGATAWSTWSYLRLQVSQRKYRAIVESLSKELIDRAVNESSNGNIESALQTIGQLEDIGASDSLTETLKGIAYATSGDSEKAVDILSAVAADKQNELAKIALVWILYDAGRLTDATLKFGEIRDEELGKGLDVEDDLARLFFARLHTYAPGTANDDSIQQLTEVLERNRYWGIGYMARAEAFLVRFHRHRKLSDLEKAFVDDYTSSVLLPESYIAKTYSLKLHVHFLQYAQAHPDDIDALTVQVRRNRAEALAFELSADPTKSGTLATWDGAVQSVQLFRTTGQIDQALELEALIKEQFGTLQTFRDGRALQESDLAAFEKSLKLADNGFTRQTYALLLREAGRRPEAIREIWNSIESADGNIDELTAAISMFDVLGEPAERANACDRLREEGTWDIWWWQETIAQFYTGEIQPDEFIAKADPFGEMLSIAHFYIGTTLLGQGKKQAAREHFAKVVETGRLGWGPHFRAEVFLDRMRQNRDWPEWIESAEDIAATSH